MKAPSFLTRLRATRKRCKSQAFVEFAFILPIFLIMMMGIFDYSFMVMRQQILAMAAREAANTASRQLPADAIVVGLNAAYNAARSVSVDFSGSLGGVIITHVWYDSAYVDPSHVLVLDSDYTGPASSSGSDTTDPTAPNVTNAIGGMGGLYGASEDNLFDKSRILAGDTNGASGWQSRYRILPFPGTDLVDGDTRGVYAVEVMYTNAFVTPIGSFMTHFDEMGGTFLIPGYLYDAAFYGVITGTPTSQITLPDPNNFSHPPPPPPAAATPAAAAAASAATAASTPAATAFQATAATSTAASATTTAPTRGQSGQSAAAATAASATAPTTFQATATAAAAASAATAASATAAAATATATAATGAPRNGSGRLTKRGLRVQPAKSSSRYQDQSDLL